jgi:hypothetical protein
MNREDLSSGIIIQTVAEFSKRFRRLPVSVQPVPAVPSLRPERFDDDDRIHGSASGYRTRRIMRPAVMQPYVGARRVLEQLKERLQHL